MIRTIGWGSRGRGLPLEPLELERRDPGPRDVVIDILFCGICHTDIHQVHDDWDSTEYPVVPGHEIVGRVRATGGGTGRFAVGDLVGVGCMVGSCGRCRSCEEGLEQYCRTGPILTCNGRDPDTGRTTMGGYSGAIVVDEAFVLSLPDGLAPAAAAPLLCAGVTVHSPLRHHGVGSGSRVGIIGVGGLGHLGIRIASAMGAHTVAFTTTPAKARDALALGASRAVVTTEEGALDDLADGFDLLLSTIGTPHDINPFLPLLRRDGSYVLLGSLEPTPPVVGALLAMPRRSITASLIGGIAETQETLDFCAEHGITADVETIRVQDVGTAFERTVAKDVRYRFVIDMSSLTEGR
ncbi:NAD(P)-dependent alcohol dehydrogenase [Nocardiopsis sp. EMB25]|uniref:NAD(P)-dependent alcohol dehydrogenase n=1 Tax=Nocardiopsis TaxID=2013 RepID=UPI00034AFF56|nr:MULTISPECIES: NAD(P)-dependent alcohol dehydrogenase [Nocardiopsis]MCY9786956.1 NAD(P)-dependent alcohol dehydrogenase [Nocardiopsis sp. EMB25]